MVSYEEKKAKALEYYRLITTKTLSLENAAEILHPDFECNFLKFKFKPGRDGYVNDIRAIAFPNLSDDFAVDIKRMIGQDNELWVWFTVKGNPVDRECIDVFDFGEDGLVRKKWDVEMHGLFEETGKRPF